MQEAPVCVQRKTKWVIASIPVVRILCGTFFSVQQRDGWLLPLRREVFSWYVSAGLRMNSIDLFIIHDRYPYNICHAGEDWNPGNLQHLHAVEQHPKPALSATRGLYNKLNFCLRRNNEKVRFIPVRAAAINDNWMF